MKKDIIFAETRIDFELFKSEVCHQLKEFGDTEFIISLLESDAIRKYYDKQWYPEALYLLTMLDYTGTNQGTAL